MASSRKFDKTIVIVTPWLGAFAGGAEALARSTAREFSRRGIPTIILTTCAQSPFDNWWQDHHAPGHSTVDGVDVRRFKTNKVSAAYRAVIEKMQNGGELSTADKQAFFDYSINSSDLISGLEQFMNDDYEILALPYFYGLTHSAAKTYPKRISLIPCFHDEQQFYWPLTGDLLANAKHIFYNSPEEKEMTIRNYGRAIGRKIVEGTVAGVAVEIADHEHNDFSPDDFSAPSLPSDYFVYVGRKEQGKNVPVLCEWFAAYAESTDNNCKLVFIGGGESKLLPRSDHFLDLGFVSETTKQEVIRRSRGIINLSENESFSIVLMEAWLMGVPAVVSARCAVMRGHVRRCNGGLYVDDISEFLAALDYLTHNPAVAERLAQNGKSYVLRNFSFDGVLARYLQAFKRKDAIRVSAQAANLDQESDV